MGSPGKKTAKAGSFPWHSLAGAYVWFRGLSEVSRFVYRDAQDFCFPRLGFSYVNVARSCSDHSRTP